MLASGMCFSLTDNQVSKSGVVLSEDVPIYFTIARKLTMLRQCHPNNARISVPSVVDLPKPPAFGFQLTNRCFFLP